MSKNYYSILGVNENSKLDEIKKAYRKLAMKHHPDKNQGNEKAEETFKDIAEAYAVLGDINNRSEYDAKRNLYNPNSRGAGGYDPSRFGNFTFDDFVSEMFGGHSTSTTNRRKRSSSSSYTRGSTGFSANTQHLDIKVNVKEDILNLLTDKEIFIEFQRTKVDGEKENKKIQFRLNLRKRYCKINNKNDSNYITITLEGMGNENVIHRMNIWGHNEEFVTIGNLIINIEIVSEKEFRIEHGDIIQDIEIDLYSALFNGNEKFIVDSILGKRYKIDIKNPKDLSSLKFTVTNQGIINSGASIGNYIANLIIKAPDVNKLSDKDKSTLEKILSNKDLY